MGKMFGAFYFERVEHKENTRGFFTERRLYTSLTVKSGFTLTSRGRLHLGGENCRSVARLIDQKGGAAMNDNFGL